MELEIKPINKCLDKKMKILGFEFPELLVIFITLSLLNFFLGKTEMRFFLVFMPSLVLASLIWISKRGKPDNYLVHFIKYQMYPRHLLAFLSPQCLMERKL